MKKVRLFQSKIGEAVNHENGDVSQKKLILEKTYIKGGPDYINGGSSKRGYYLVSRVLTEKKSTNGFVSTSFFMFDGSKKLIQEVKRFSKKQYDALDLQSIDQDDFRIVKQMLVSVYGKHLNKNIKEEPIVDYMVFDSINNLKQN